MARKSHNQNILIKNSPEKLILNETGGLELAKESEFVLPLLVRGLENQRVI